MVWSIGKVKNKPSQCARFFYGRNMDKQYIDQTLIAILYVVTVLIMFLYLSKKRKVDSELNLIFAIYFPVYLLFKKFFRFGKT